MFVTWTLIPLIEAKGFILTYEVSYEGTSSRRREILTKTVDANTNATFIDGLDPGQIYTVQVAATTSAGQGASSESVSLESKLDDVCYSVSVKLKMFKIIPYRALFPKDSIFTNFANQNG